MAKFISFLTQKGGVCKTTLSILSATYLDHTVNSVTVIDCDFPQHSFQKTRKKDLNDLAYTSTLAEENKNKTYYPIASVQVNQVDMILQALKTSQSLDYVFVDVPGTLNIDGLDTIIELLDLIIVPLEMEYKSIASALESVTTIRKYNPTVKIAFLWTRLNKIHQVAERKAYEEYIRVQGDIHTFDFILFTRVNVSRILSTIKTDVETAKPLVDELNKILATLFSPEQLVKNGEV